MDLKAIQEILRFVNKSDLTEVELEEGDFKLKIKRRNQGGSGDSGSVDYALNTPNTPSFVPPSVSRPAAMDNQAAGENVPRETEAPASTAPAATGGKQHTVNSPMIGTFYRSASPDKPSYANVGDTVRAGQTLCIIEAMKLFNEIESEVEGRIVKILVENAQPVEYDQPLFIIELTK